jgi:Xaa-Pro aminopeptidase
VEQAGHPNLYRRAGNLIAYPYFSLEERERRWALLRIVMREAGLDCVVVPPGRPTSPEGATARYLTHVGGGHVPVAAVLPLGDGAAAVVRNVERWLLAQPWCHDLREAGDSYAAGVAAKLEEIELSGARLGVFGLAPPRDSGIEGASHGFVDALQRRLPGLDCVDFTQPMQAIRACKSAEEVAFLQRSGELLQHAWRAAHGAANLSNGEEVLEGARGAAIEQLCALGSELPTRGRWQLDSFHDSSFLLAEIEAGWGGYRVSSAAAIPLRRQTPTPLRELAARAAAAWDAWSRSVRPGTNLAAAAERAKQRAHCGVSDHGALEVGVSVVGCGLGFDPPARPDLAAELAPEEGWCLYCRVELRQGQLRAQWGEAVLVTAGGARQLAGTPQANTADRVLFH